MEKWVKREWKELKVGDRIKWKWHGTDQYDMHKGTIKEYSRSEIYTDTGWKMFLDSGRTIWRDEGDNKNLGCMECGNFLPYLIAKDGCHYHSCKYAPTAYYPLQGPIKDPDYCRAKNVKCECSDWIPIVKEEPKKKSKDKKYRFLTRSKK